MNSDEVYNHIKKICHKYKVKFIIKKQGELSMNNVRVNGYFNHEDRELAVTTSKNNPDQNLYIAIHEFNHLLQYIENPHLYTYLVNSSIIFDAWLNGKEYKNEIINEHINNLIKLESDCEQKTLAFIKSNNINLNIKLYTQKANAYILFYHSIKKNGKWYSIGNEPYNNEQLLKNMPTEFLKDYINPPKKLLSYY